MERRGWKRHLCFRKGRLNTSQKCQESPSHDMRTPLETTNQQPSAIPWHENPSVNEQSAAFCHLVLRKSISAVLFQSASTALRLPPWVQLRPSPCYLNITLSTWEMWHSSLQVNDRVPKSQASMDLLVSTERWTGQRLKVLFNWQNNRRGKEWNYNWTVMQFLLKALG